MLTHAGLIVYRPNEISEQQLPTMNFQPKEAIVVSESYTMEIDYRKNTHNNYCLN